MILAHEINAPLLHNCAHDSTKNTRDLEGNQTCFRTWKHLACLNLFVLFEKHLACLNQTLEQAMHAPTLGKRPFETTEVDETEQARKKVQISNGDHNLLVQAVVQPHQSQCVVSHGTIMGLRTYVQFGSLEI